MLTRANLREMDLQSDQINNIMALHGQSIQERNEEVADLKEQVKNLQAKQSEPQAMVESLQKEINEKENKITELQHELEAKEQAIEDNAIDHALIQAGADEKYIGYLKGELDNVEGEDLDDKVKLVQENLPKFFVPTQPEGPTDNQGYRVVDTRLSKVNPSAEWTKDSIMQVEDRDERLKLIQKHGHLFN